VSGGKGRQPTDNRPEPKNGKEKKSFNKKGGGEREKKRGGGGTPGETPTLGRESMSAAQESIYQTARRGKRG